MSGTNTVYAVIADGAGGTTVQFVDFGVPITGTYVACSPAGSIGATPLVQYNFDLAAQLPKFLAKAAAGAATCLVAIGDSVTKGFGTTQTSANIVQLSYPSEMAQTLNAQGIPANYANFVGVDDLFGVSVDFRLQFLPTAQLGTPLAGGYTVLIEPTLKFGFSFAANAAATYDQAIITYLDSGWGAIKLALDTTQAAHHIRMHGTDTIKSQTVDFPSGQYTTLTVTLDSIEAVYVQSAAISASTAPAILVYNAGSGGMTTVGELEPAGKSPLDGAIALAPDLALVNLGINDIIFGVPLATTLANLDTIVTTLQDSGAEVILFVPLPCGEAQYSTEIPALRAGMQSLAMAKNIPLIDLGLTYNDSFDELNNAGLMGDIVHPNATLDADIGTQLATILATAIKAA